MSRFTVLPLALAMLAPLAPPAFAAPSDRLIEATSRVDAVTVYPDRAQVRRLAHVELAPGMYKVRFPRLARDLMSDSVRVGGEGSAAAILHGFDLRTQYLGVSPTKQVQALENRLLSLGDADRTLADQRAVHERQFDTLVETSEKASSGLSTQLATGKANLKNWSELLGYLKTQQSAEAKAIQAIDKQRRGLASQITAVKIELGKLRGFRREEVYMVDVSVEITRGGTLDLALEYVMPGASWSPAYDARLDAKGERLDWRYYGVVRQSTGENWTDVALRLSTARPASGSQPPLVAPWFLSLYRPEMDRPAPAPAVRAMGATQNVFNQRSDRKAAASAEESVADKPAAEPVAVVAEQGTSITLEVPRRVDIPSDGEPHQTPIGPISIKPKTAYRVVPRITTDAFLEVEAVHPGPWPLIAGPVKAFVGKDYVGTSPLREDINPNQRFTLPMGIDRAINVKRVRISKQTGQSGLLQKRGFAEYRYEVAITNFKPTAQSITVIEPIPQATDDEIKVTLGAATFAPQNGVDMPPGQVRWKLMVQPGEKKTLNWGYRVEWEPGQMPQGLE